MSETWLGALWLPNSPASHIAGSFQVGVNGGTASSVHAFGCMALVGIVDFAYQSKRSSSNSRRLACCCSSTEGSS
eukprot:12880591-Prorocentrum_lima.AAC.1